MKWKYFRTWYRTGLAMWHLRNNREHVLMRGFNPCNGPGGAARLSARLSCRLHSGADGHSTSAKPLTVLQFSNVIPYLQKSKCTCKSEFHQLLVKDFASHCYLLP